MGIPGEQVKRYQKKLDDGQYMIRVQGTQGELNQAASVLNARNISDWQVYDPRGDHPKL